MIDQYAHLLEGEELALALRRERKVKLKDRPVLAKNTIIFPPMHIGLDDNRYLRRSMNPLYNGFMIATQDYGILVDPGIGFPYRRLKAGYPISWCDTMFITHQHIDHIGGAPEFLEWLLRAGKMIDLICTPESVKDGNIPQYYLGVSPERANHRIHYLDTEKVIQCGPVSFQTINHFHGINCFGFTTQIGGKKITHISDTGYATLVEDDEGQKVPGKDDIIGKPRIVSKHENIKTALAGSSIAIINMDTLQYRKRLGYTHASAIDIIDMVKDNGIGTLIISHINPTGQYEPEWIQKLQEYIQDQTGVPTIIPGIDGLELEF